MRKVISEDVISEAIKAIIDSKIADSDKITVPSEFKGYVSSFGAAIIQSGILPALIFFEDKGGASKDRPKLLEAIMRLNSWPADDEKYSLVNYYKDFSGNRRALEAEILNSAVAIKLALRTFKFE
jgi:CRISPR-associated protein Cmr5